MAPVSVSSAHAGENAGRLLQVITADLFEVAFEPPWLGRSAAIASIVTALFLVGLKLWAVWQTESMAVLGSLADSALDLVASIVTLTGVVIAARPADRTHRFGHGKAEALAAVFQVMLIALSAAGIAMRSSQALVAGERVAGAGEGIVVTAIALAATFALLAYQRYVLARTRSVAIHADHLLRPGIQQTARIAARAEGAV